MYLTGFADEAARDIDSQIQAVKELGWSNMESRNIDGVNIHDLPENTFEQVCDKLGESGVRINCFGSAIGNWSKPITKPPDSSYEEMRRAIPRMQKLGTKMIRIMSFSVPGMIPLDDLETSKEVVRRLKELVTMAEDGGVLCVHENCMNYGGQSYEHTLRLLGEIQSPALRLVFDTGNPVFARDVRGRAPYEWQDSLEFYNKVSEHVAYVHIKDAFVKEGGEKPTYTFPGEGAGHIPEILEDLHRRGYDGGFSIEPHMMLVAHDKSVQSAAEAQFANYVEYGRRIEKIVRQIGWKV